MLQCNRMDVLQCNRVLLIAVEWGVSYCSVMGCRALQSNGEDVVHCYGV